MEFYEDLLKAKSLDELLQEAQVLQRKPLDVVAFDGIKVRSLEVMAKTSRTSEDVRLYGAVKIMGKKTLNYLTGFIHGFFETCFGISTMIRRQNQKKNETSESYEMGYYLGWLPPFALTCFSMGALPIYGNYKLISEYPTVGWGLLGTQITTNALSGLYEWFRYEKGKLKQKGEIENGK